MCSFELDEQVCNRCRKKIAVLDSISDLPWKKFWSKLLGGKPVPMVEESSELRGLQKRIETWFFKRSLYRTDQIHPSSTFGFPLKCSLEVNTSRNRVRSHIPNGNCDREICKTLTIKRDHAASHPPRRSGPVLLYLPDSDPKRYGTMACAIPGQE